MPKRRISRSALKEALSSMEELREELKSLTSVVEDLRDFFNESAEKENHPDDALTVHKNKPVTGSTQKQPQKHSMLEI